MIAELNRVGILVDISHPSKEANLQAIALSKAPVIASHSGARAMFDHSRNLDDEQLAALKKNGGVVQTVAFAGYVKVTPPSAERTAALAKLAEEYKVPAAALGRGGGRGRAAAQVAAAAGAATAAGAAAARRGRDAATTRSRRSARSSEPRCRRKLEDAEREIPGTTARERQGLRRPRRLPGQEDRHRPCRHLVGLRRRRRRRRLERRQRNLQRHAGAGAARLHRSTDRQIWSGNLLRVMDQAQKIARDTKK